MCRASRQSPDDPKAFRPSTALKPARRAEGFWRNVQSPQILHPAAALETPMAPLDIVDFHNHHVPARFALTAVQAAPPSQRARWEVIGRKLRDEDLLATDVGEGRLR